MTLKEGPGATRPAGDEEDHAEKEDPGGSRSSLPSKEDEGMKVPRSLASVKMEQDSDDSCYEPIILTETKNPKQPPMDFSQASLLLLKAKNLEKEDLRTRLHKGCVFKYYTEPTSDQTFSQRVDAHPVHVGTGGTRVVFTCPWHDKLVMKFSPWDQSSEKTWLDKLGRMSVKIVQSGTAQAQLEGKNGSRSSEVWSMTLATRAAPVTDWTTTRAWELALLLGVCSQVGNICDVGVSNVMQHPEAGYLQLIDAGTWISREGSPRWPSKSRASGFWSLLNKHQPEVAAVVKSALMAAGPWGYRQFIPAIVGALVTREPHVQTLLARLLGSGALLRDPSRAVCFPILVSKPDEVPMKWELMPLQIHAEDTE